MNFNTLSLKLHAKHRGKLEVTSKVPLETREDLSSAYTPGVAEPCRKIAKDPSDAYRYTMKANTVAVVTDGSAVLGLGNIGALAGLPVMEGKCLLFKQFAGIDAIPICLSTQDPEAIISAVVAIAPTFGGINLEDIAAPKCFEIERRLIAELPIPIFHDDQHGTAIVVLAGLINSLKIVKKSMGEIRCVLAGAGAAGIAISKLLLLYGVRNIVLTDRAGIIYEGRDGLNGAKSEMATVTNPDNLRGSLSDALRNADVFIGISGPNLVTTEMVRSMAADPVVFAMANPDPEIFPDEAYAGGAVVVATGRSDFPNQINNILAFPGVFRGVLDIRARYITDAMKIAAASALAALVPNPTPDKILPSVFDQGVSEAVAVAVIGAAKNI